MASKLDVDKRRVRVRVGGCVALESHESRDGKKGLKTVVRPSAGPTGDEKEDLNLRATDRWGPSTRWALASRTIQY